MFKPKFSSSGASFNSGFTYLQVIKGDDGFSPIVNIEEVPEGHKITIIDKDNTEHFIVLNGEDGLSPTIKDGYWYIGDLNTGVKASGEIVSGTGISVNVEDGVSTISLDIDEVIIDCGGAEEYF